MPQYIIRNSRTGERRIIEWAGEAPPTPDEVRILTSGPATVEGPAAEDVGIPDPVAQYGGRSQDKSLGQFIRNVGKDVLPTAVDVARGVGNLVTDPAGTATNVVRGLKSVTQQAVTDPTGTLLDVAESAYQRPVQAASMVMPVSGGPVGAALRGGSKLASIPMKAGARVWWQKLAKVPVTLRKANRRVPFAEVALEEGISPTRRGAAKASRRIEDLDRQSAEATARSSALINPRQALTEVDEAIATIDPAADNFGRAKAMQNVREQFDKGTGLGAAQPASRMDRMKSQFQQQASSTWGRAAKELEGQEYANKLMAQGTRRVVDEAVPEAVPINARQSDLIAVRNAAERRADVFENQNVIPARLLFPGIAGGLGLFGGGPAGAVLGAGLGYALEHPGIGGMGARALWKMGKGIDTAGQGARQIAAPALIEQQLVEEAMRRALLDNMQD